MRSGSEHIGFDYVVAFETDCVFDDSGNWDLIDSCQLKVIARQVHWLRSVGGIHHTQPISTTGLKGQVVNIRVGLAIYDPATFLK
jgi:hypothetical protein